MLDTIRLLYDYSYWATARVLRAAEGISAGDLCAPADFPMGSLRGTLVHALSAEWIWRQRWNGIMPAAMLVEADFPTIGAIAARWDEEEAAMRAFIAALSDTALHRTVTVVNTRGVAFPPLPLWQMMIHLVNHGTQHRSEAAAILSSLGRSPGDLDLILFLREQRASQT